MTFPVGFWDAGTPAADPATDDVSLEQHNMNRMLLQLGVTAHLASVLTKEGVMGYESVLGIFRRRNNSGIQNLPSIIVGNDADKPIEDVVNNGAWYFSIDTGVLSVIHAGKRKQISNSAKLDSLYIVSNSNDSLYTLDKTTGIVTLVKAITFPDLTNTPNAIAWDGKYIYVSEVNNDKLHRIDPISASREEVGTLVDVSSIAWDGKDLYGINTSTNRLVRISKKDASVENVGGVLSALGWSGMTWDGKYLYAIATNENSLYRIDPATGVATRVGRSGALGSANWGALAWDNKDLFTVNNTTHTLFKVSRRNGTTTKVGVTGVLGTVTVDGMAYVEAIVIEGKYLTVAGGPRDNSSNIDANNVTSGIFNAGRLGSGTPDATKILFGDAAWKDIPIFDIHGNINAEMTAPDGLDRLIASNESESDDPTQWLTLTRLRVWLQTHFELSSGRITADVIDAARLGSGTASSATGLFGDSAWKYLLSSRRMTSVEYNALANKDANTLYVVVG